MALGPTKRRELGCHVGSKGGGLKRARATAAGRQGGDQAPGRALPGGTGDTSLGHPGLRRQDPLQHFPASPPRVSLQAGQPGWTGVFVPPVSHAI